VAGDGDGPPWRVLFASDLHLGLPWTRRAPEDLLHAVLAEAPDVVLLGGDLVDGVRGLSAVAPCVRGLSTLAPVAAVPGNHDVAAGAAAVRCGVLEGGGAWLPDAPLDLRRSDGAVLRCAGMPLQRPADGAVNVACLHDPADADDAARAGYDVAFAGHLHGGQCVWFERGGRHYPGAWLDRRTGPRFVVGALRLFVAAGLGDTVPLRFRCPYELIVCEVGARRPTPARGS
jgi:uncharacterized protein